MAMDIAFFPRQAVTANAASSADFHSAIFDVSEYDKLTVVLQVFSSDPANAQYDAQLQHTSDPTLGDSAWIDLGSAISVTASSGTGSSVSTESNPLRFVRVKLTVASGAQGTVMVAGVGRSD